MHHPHNQPSYSYFISILLFWTNYNLTGFEFGIKIILEIVIKISILTPPILNFFWRVYFLVINSNAFYNFYFFYQNNLNFTQVNV